MNPAALAGVNDAMNANMKLGRAEIEPLLTRWAAKRGWKLSGFRLTVQQGDPGDPREAGFRSEDIHVDVDMDPAPPQQSLPNIGPSPGPDAAEMVELAQEAKAFVREAGEGSVPDEILMRAAVTLGMLVRRGMLAPFADPMTRAHAIALIAHNFADDPPSTPHRAALFAMKLDGE